MMNLNLKIILAVLLIAKFSLSEKSNIKVIFKSIKYQDELLNDCADNKPDLSVCLVKQSISVEKRPDEVKTAKKISVSNDLKFKVTWRKLGEVVNNDGNQMNETDASETQETLAVSYLLSYNISKPEYDSKFYGLAIDCDKQPVSNRSVIVTTDQNKVSLCTKQKRGTAVPINITELCNGYKLYFVATNKTCLQPVALNCSQLLPVRSTPSTSTTTTTNPTTTTAATTTKSTVITTRVATTSPSSFAPTTAPKPVLALWHKTLVDYPLMTFIVMLVEAVIIIILVIVIIVVVRINRKPQPKFITDDVLLDTSVAPRTMNDTNRNLPDVSYTDDFDNRPSTYINDREHDNMETIGLTNYNPHSGGMSTFGR